MARGPGINEKRAAVHGMMGGRVEEGRRGGDNLVLLNNWWSDKIWTNF